MATTPALVTAFFKNAVKTYEEQMDLLSLCATFKPNPADMQNSGDVMWRTVEQSAPIIKGWDLTGQDTDIIKEEYPTRLGIPNNDLVTQRADDLRDIQFWEERGRVSGRRQAGELNRAIAELIVNTGSIYYQLNATNGYDFISEADTLIDERQKTDVDRTFLLSNRENQVFGKDLAGRQTLQGQPEETYKTGRIFKDIAGFDVYKGNFLPNITGRPQTVAPTTVVADISERPESGEVDIITNTVTNIDYRLGTIPVTNAGDYEVGDWIAFNNGADPVQAMALADKIPTSTQMPFKVVGKAGNTLTVYPKPIAVDDPSLNILERAYANIDTQIRAGAEVVRLNTFNGTGKANPFWCKDSIEVVCGDAPAQLLEQFGGKKVIKKTMKNGQVMYMLYDGDIFKMNFTYRIFTWWSLVNKDPSANGVAVRVG